MDVHRFLFLSLGLARAHSHKDRKRAKRTGVKLIEPQGSRSCRRNIIVLSGVLFLAGLAGADLHSLNLFGIKPTSKWGVAVLGCAAIFAQIYWYVLRYQHLSEDGTYDPRPGPDGIRSVKTLPIQSNNKIDLARKSADLFANWVAFVMTLASWFFIFPWIIESLSG